MKSEVLSATLRSNDEVDLVRNLVAHLQGAGSPGAVVVLVDNGPAEDSLHVEGANVSRYGMTEAGLLMLQMSAKEWRACRCGRDHTPVVEALEAASALVERALGLNSSEGGSSATH